MSASANWVRVIYSNTATGNFTTKLNVRSNKEMRIVLYNSDSNLRAVTVPANTEELIEITNPLTVEESTVYINMFIPNASIDDYFFVDNISLFNE